MQLMTHPLYDPDLAPCNFFLFPFIKAKMRRFNTSEAAVEAFVKTSFPRARPDKYYFWDKYFFYQNIFCYFIVL